jgi:hypothetical protein
VEGLFEQVTDIKDNAGKKALTYAEQAGNAEIIRLLKEAAVKQNK